MPGETTNCGEQILWLLRVIRRCRARRRRALRRLGVRLLVFRGLDGGRCPSGFVSVDQLIAVGIEPAELGRSAQEFAAQNTSPSELRSIRVNQSGPEFDGNMTV